MKPASKRRGKASEESLDTEEPVETAEELIATDESEPELGGDEATTRVRVMGAVIRPDPLDEQHLSLFVQLGRQLEADVYVLLHGRGNGPEQVQSLSELVYEQFRSYRADLKGRRAVLVVDSPGGQASAAYKIARLFQHAADDFIVAIPRYAMSAGTLLSLGAREIHMGADAQIGPLDVQLHDREKEEWSSALDEVQSLDQITAAAIAQADQAMFFLLTRSGKKLETLIPLALDFAAKLQAPMVEKIDTIHYSQQSRILKVAQDYAERLLSHHHSEPKAQSIAQTLVHEYPEHGFVIDKVEASSFLCVSQDPIVAEILDRIGMFIDTERPILFGKVEADDQGDLGDSTE